MPSAPSQLQAQKACPSCGATMSEISKTGKVGCAACYQTFREELRPSLQRIHGSVRYAGAQPGEPAQAAAESPPPVGAQPAGNILARKKELLARAIAEERYEDAIVVRDEIRKLEEGGEGK
jgi:protein arginine kinase activator